ncbi:MAG: ribosome-associated translation inhibitor RaiA [Chitinophagales bacterium]|nr:ribosome-associated translation inhibitor RaiA [Chitinophagales bacterium]
MNVLINATFQVNDYLKSVIEEKVNKLKIHFDRITQAEIYLKIGENRHRHAEDQIVELRVSVPGYTFFAEDHSDTFEKSVAGAADKVLQQIKKYKSKHYSHH